MDSAPPSHKGHRYPVEIIAHCVWPYHRFPLSFREVEELVFERGVLVSCEAVRRRCAKVGQGHANGLCHRGVRPGDKGHLDEAFVRINGELKYLWRAVDADGNVLGILLQGRRDTAAARRFSRRLLKRTRSVPRVIVTDKLRSCGAAHREVMPSAKHRPHKGLNNRAENSHQPTRRRERTARGFRSVGGAQRFLASFSGISPHFRPRRHRTTTLEYRAETTVRFPSPGSGHRRRRPARRGLRTEPEPGPTASGTPSGTHTLHDVTAPRRVLACITPAPPPVGCAKDSVSSQRCKRPTTSGPSRPWWRSSAERSRADIAVVGLRMHSSV
ncbi:hypothetical protein GCM10010398_61690 [Streptomyces fimbriatus]